jgi:lipopolysaccharide transport system ATP-binding protein
MSEIAIRVDKLGKRYRIGSRGSRFKYRSLRDDLSGLGKRLLQRLGGKKNELQAQDVIWALDDVSFEIHQGDSIGIIGRNGAGKSTLLKVLSHITSPTRGRVEIHGRLGSLLEVGTGFHPELTGRENIYLNGAILGMKKREIERKFDEIIAFADIEKFLDTPVKRYSSGMYMRLAFGVAAHMDPDILLVDEVLAVGDIAFQKKCLGKMSEVSRGGRTVLFVSHNMAAVRQLCQKGFFFHEGRLVSQGSIESVINKYVGEAVIGSDRLVLKPSDHVTQINGIMVKEVYLIDGLNNSFTVALNQPIIIDIHLEVTRSIPHANFGARITLLDGYPIFSVRHTDLGAENWTFEPGKYVVRVEMENRLRLGVYNLVINVFEGAVKDSVFYIPTAIRFEVAAAGENDLRYFEHNAGVVNGVSTWQSRLVMMPEVSVIISINNRKPPIELMNRLDFTYQRKDTRELRREGFRGEGFERAFKVMVKHSLQFIGWMFHKTGSLFTDNSSSLESEESL